jgi:hypothetical protein
MSATMARLEMPHSGVFQDAAPELRQVEGGMYGYARAVFGVSRKLGAGNLLYGGEVYHDNGPWDASG